MSAVIALGIYILVKVDELQDGSFNHEYQHHEDSDTDR